LIIFCNSYNFLIQKPQPKLEAGACPTNLSAKIISTIYPQKGCKNVGKWSILSVKKKPAWRKTKRAIIVNNCISINCRNDKKRTMTVGEC